MNDLQLDPTGLTAVFGTAQPPPSTTQIRSGEFIICVSHGQISRVEWQGNEVLRGVTYLVRDKEWATPDCRVEFLPCEAESILHLSGKINQYGIAFAYNLKVSSDDANSLHIETTGHALGEFEANRIGLTVLHPAPECCGRPLEVRHGNGDAEATEFPVSIMPAQPVFDIAGLYHQMNGCDVELDFDARRPDGTSEYFEMEDQRNWGDASYKTYIGSLRDPWPFAVKRGDRFSQSVRIAVRPVTTTPLVIKTTTGATEQSTSDFRCPAIAVSIPLGGAREALENVKRFGPVRPSRFSAYLQSNALHSEELDALAEISDLAGCPLGIELEVCGPSEAELHRTAGELRSKGISPHSIQALPAEYTRSYQPDTNWPDVMPLEQFYPLVRKAFPASRIGGGMLTYFTELNRKWPPGNVIDYVAHAYCPIVHAADDTTVLQNLETLQLIAASVARKMPGIPYEIVSAQISMRQNPYGATPVQNTSNMRLPMGGSDPREAGQFGGMWMLEVAERVANGHARLLTLGALSGPASIYSVQREDGRLPSWEAVNGLIELEGVGRGEFERVRQQLVDRHFQLAKPVFDAVLRG